MAKTLDDLPQDYVGAIEADAAALAEKPCTACPWVSTDQRDRDAVGDLATQAAMKAGAWFCCHVNMGTCHGAALLHKKHLRQTDKEKSDAEVTSH